MNDTNPKRPHTTAAYPEILFEPVKIGDVVLPNRVLMAPLTRDRAHADGTPREMAVTYYRQRASAGLVISEGTSPSPLAKGYIDTPGIYTDAHVAAWKTITDAVHASGGRIFVQLWHVGRVSHDSMLPSGEVPVAPSAIPGEITTFAPEGVVSCTPPAPLSRRKSPISSRNTARQRIGLLKPASTASKSTPRTVTCWISSCTSTPTNAKTDMEEVLKIGPG